MKKNLIFAMGLISITTFAQVGRVGINNDQPRATLDIVGKPFTGEATDKTFSRGVILPHISDAQKAEFTDKTEGLMIWNTTKKCIDYWDGTKWQCYGATNDETPTEEIKTYTCDEYNFNNNNTQMLKAVYTNGSGFANYKCGRHHYGSQTIQYRFLNYSDDDITGDEVYKILEPTTVKTGDVVKILEARREYMSDDNLIFYDTGITAKIENTQ